MPHDDFYYPRIPTSRQNVSKTSFTNADLRRPSMDALSLEDAILANNKEVYERLQNEPIDATGDYALGAAQRTLEETQPTANRFYGAGLSVSNPADAAAAREQGRTQRESSREYRNAAMSPMIAGSFVPGPIGAISQAGLSVGGMLDATDEDLPATDRMMGGAFGALGVSPAMKALKGLRGAGRQPIPRVTGQGSELPYRASMEAGEGVSTGGAMKSLRGRANEPQIEVLDDIAPYVDDFMSQTGGSKDEIAALIAEMETRASSVPTSRSLRSLQEGVIPDFRQTALQALEEGDEVSKRSPLFGGATSSEEGTYGAFVRPSKRTPIGRRPAAPVRRGEREEAISWNPR